MSVQQQGRRAGKNYARKIPHQRTELWDGFKVTKTKKSIYEAIEVCLIQIQTYEVMVQECGDHQLIGFDQHPMW